MFKKFNNLELCVRYKIWVSSGIFLAMTGQGMLFGFSSCLLPALRAPDSPIKADLSTSTWIVSSVGIAGIPGFFISSFLMVSKGRRIAHALALIPGIAGWFFVCFAKDVTSLLIGRILGGMTSGSCLGLGAIVIGEYTSPKQRGMFLNLKTTCVCFGAMVVHILGQFLHWKTIAGIALIPHFVSLLVTLTWPESPAWLASKNEYEKSKKSFYWLRGHSEKSVREFEELIALSNSQPAEETSFVNRLVMFLNKFKHRDFNMPILIISLGAVMLEVGGRHIFPAYALDILGEITGNKSSSFLYTLAIDLIITLSTTCSTVLIRIVKRRTLLFASGFLTLAVLFAACIYLLLVSKGVLSSDHTWIPISLFIAYFVLTNFGCTPIPLCYLGEMLPLAHRGSGQAVVGVVFPLTLQFGLQITPFLLASVHVHGTFFVLGSTTGICLIILYFIVPETKDKTLQEIELYFTKGEGKSIDNVETKMLQT